MVDNTSFWRMHDDVPLVVAEVNPEALDAHNGIVANPNCSTMQMVVALDADPSTRSGIERIVVSTYQSRLRHGPARDRGARGADRRAAPRRRSRRRRGLSAPDRLQRPAPGRDLQGRRRLHDRGAQDDGRDAQDPRRRRGRARHLGDLRPRAGPDGPVGVGEHRRRARRSRPRSAASCWPLRPASLVVDDARRRASTRWRPRPRAATRCSSGGSAATPPTSAASTCGSSATTCARARRPTPSRSPSCSTSAGSFGSPRGRRYRRVGWAALCRRSSRFC